MSGTGESDNNFHFSLPNIFRSQGVSQGVQVHLGTDDQVHHRQFYSSLLWCPCGNTPNVHVCSMGAAA